MEILANGRGGGKTTVAVAWLLSGEPRDHLLRWSRVLVVDDADRGRWFLDKYPVPERLVLTVAQLRAGYLRGLDVEYALDDAQDVLRDALGGTLPALAFIQGTSWLETSLVDHAPDRADLGAVGMVERMIAARGGMRGGPSALVRLWPGAAGVVRGSAQDVIDAAVARVRTAGSAEAALPKPRIEP